MVRQFEPFNFCRNRAEGGECLMSAVWILTHWGRDKMAAISQTTLSNPFSWMKIFEFRITFHWSLLLWFQLTIFQHWFRWWLGADQATSHYLNQWWSVYWRIYASLGLNELSAHECTQNVHLTFVSWARYLCDRRALFYIMLILYSLWYFLHQNSYELLR